MKEIITPVLGPQGHTPIHLKKDMNGNILILWGNEGARLAPREAYDMAILMLKAIGCEIGETFKRPDDIGGGQLKARIKIA